MHTACEYREYAQDCIDSARMATSDAVRTQFLELAKLWLTAALQLELRAQVELRAHSGTTWPSAARSPQERPSE